MVGFRAATQRMANTLNLRGIVRNLRNGDVEILAEGEEQDLRRLAEWARHGPASARVDRLHVDYSDTLNGHQGFSAE